MKKLLFFLVLISGHFAFGQNNAYKKAINVFEGSFNKGKYDSIFFAFSPVMQKAFPLNNTIEFLTGLKTTVGNIKGKNFIGFQNDTYASYKTVFEKGERIINFSLDENNNINGLQILPLTDSTKLVNALTGVPAQIAKLVLENIKVLPQKTQLAIAVIQKGQVKFYGILKNHDSLKVIQNNNSVFQIGSITKVFTSTLLADAVLENRIALNDTINAYYKFPFSKGIKITFLSLANHTSGLPRLPSNFTETDNPYNDYTTKKLLAYLKDSLQLQSKLGEKYDYSNLGGGLLGYTLGLAEKSSYSDLLNTAIFKKYKMVRSYTNSKNIKDGLVAGLDDDGHPVINWIFDVLVGGGGILSTVSDLSKFAKAQFNPDNKELALTRKMTFTISNEMKIGLGWHIVKMPYCKEMYWHNGGTKGYSSSIALDIGQKNGVIILSNVSAFNRNTGNIDNLCFELMKSIDKNKIL